MTLFNPNLLSENSDPEGSTRHKGVDITLLRIECTFEQTLYKNEIAEENRFVIADYSPKHTGLKKETFKGTVVEETNGAYSWWRNIT